MFVSKELTVKRARCAYRCEWCGELINKASTYNRYSIFSYQSIYTIKMHPECLKAMHTEADDAGGWLEFIPFDQERPAA